MVYNRAELEAALSVYETLEKATPSQVIHPSQITPSLKRRIEGAIRQGTRAFDQKAATRQAIFTLFSSSEPSGVMATPGVVFWEEDGTFQISGVDQRCQIYELPNHLVAGAFAKVPDNHREGVQVTMMNARGAEGLSLLFPHHDAIHGYTPSPIQIKSQTTQHASGHLAPGGQGFDASGLAFTGGPPPPTIYAPQPQSQNSALVNAGQSKIPQQTIIQAPQPLSELAQTSQDNSSRQPLWVPEGADVQWDGHGQFRMNGGRAMRIADLPDDAIVTGLITAWTLVPSSILSLFKELIAERGATAVLHISHQLLALRPELLSVPASADADLLKRAAKATPWSSRVKGDTMRYLGELPNKPRDPEPADRVLWDGGQDPVDDRPMTRRATQKNKGVLLPQPKTKDEQADMKYYCGPMVSRKDGGQFSFFCLPGKHPKWDTTAGPNRTGLLVVVEGTHLLPVNIRQYDVYLGATILSDIPHQGIEFLFPFDFSKDGHPFPDRRGVGPAFRPRAAFKDYANGGQFEYDDRVAYYKAPRRGEQNFPFDVIILGGDEFQVSSITNYQWEHFYRFFVEIKKNGWSSLLKVEDEPEHLRRMKLPLSTLVNIPELDSPKPATKTTTNPESLTKPRKDEPRKDEPRNDEPTMLKPPFSQLSLPNDRKEILRSISASIHSSSESDRNRVDKDAKAATKTLESIQGRGLVADTLPTTENLQSEIFWSAASDSAVLHSAVQEQFREQLELSSSNIANNIRDLDGMANHLALAWLEINQVLGNHPSLTYIRNLGPVCSSLMQIRNNLTTVHSVQTSAVRYLDKAVANVLQPLDFLNVVSPLGKLGQNQKALQSAVSRYAQYPDPPATFAKKLSWRANTDVSSPAYQIKLPPLPPFSFETEHYHGQKKRGNGENVSDGSSSKKARTESEVAPRYVPPPYTKYVRTGDGNYIDPDNSFGGSISEWEYNSILAQQALAQQALAQQAQADQQALADQQAASIRHSRIGTMNDFAAAAASNPAQQVFFSPSQPRSAVLQEAANLQQYTGFANSPQHMFTTPVRPQSTVLPGAAYHQSPHLQAVLGVNAVVTQQKQAHSQQYIGFSNSPHNTFTSPARAHSTVLPATANQQQSSHPQPFQGPNASLMHRVQTQNPAQGYSQSQHPQAFQGPNASLMHQEQTQNPAQGYSQSPHPQAVSATDQLAANQGQTQNMTLKSEATDIPNQNFRPNEHDSQGVGPVIVKGPNQYFGTPAPQQMMPKSMEPPGPSKYFGSGEVAPDSQSKSAPKPGKTSRHKTGSSRSPDSSPEAGSPNGQLMTWEYIGPTNSVGLKAAIVALPCKRPHIQNNQNLRTAIDECLLSRTDEELMSKAGWATYIKQVRAKPATPTPKKGGKRGNKKDS